MANKKLQNLRRTLDCYGAATYSEDFRADLYEAVCDVYPPPVDQPDTCPSEFDSDLNAAYNSCLVADDHSAVLDAFLELMAHRTAE